MYYVNESDERMQYREESFTGYLSRVFLLMFLGLGLTSVIAVYGAQSEAVLRFVIQMESNSFYFFGILALYLGLSFGFHYAVQKMNTAVAMLLYLAYAAFTGLTWSVLFAVIAPDVIWKAFLSAGIFFGVMALYGMTTKRNLASLQTLLRAGLWAILISLALNLLFFRSGGFDLLISVVGVALFAGYTAYDIQMLRRLYEQNEGSMALNAIAIFGAFQLYLDFINLFLYLLRLFASRDD